MRCPNCGNEAQEDAIFCDQCGTRLRQLAESPASASMPQPSASTVAAQAAICPSCGASATPGELFCGECGAKLEAPQPEPAGAAVLPAGAVSAAAGGLRTCPDCGAQVADGDEFCYACGVDLRARAAQMAASAPSIASKEPSVPAASAAPPAATGVPVVGGVASADMVVCPACGAQVRSGDRFCDHCGATLAPASGVGSLVTQPTSAAQPAQVMTGGRARLIVVASGVELPLSAGKETLVGREDPYSGVFPDIDLTPYGGEEGGVSRRHFKITLTGGQYMIEDLNSTNFTILNRQKLQPGVPAVLTDGDEIRAGRVKLIFRVS